MTDLPRGSSTRGPTPGASGRLHLDRRDRGLRSLDPGSLEEFLAEHYYGYVRQPGRGTLEYAVEHPPWQIWPADEAGFEADVRSLYGDGFASALARPPDRRLPRGRIADSGPARDDDLRVTPPAPSAWVLYDGACGFCSRWVPFWKNTLAKRGLGIASLQEPWVVERLRAQGVRRGEPARRPSDPRRRIRET